MADKLNLDKNKTQKCMCQRCSINTINWETSSRYLGVYLESSVKFKCSFSMNKVRFYKALLLNLTQVQ